jgi:integrase
MRRPDKIARKGGISWQIRVTDQNGRMRYKTFRTKAEAEAALLEHQRSPITLSLRFDELAREFDAAHIVNLRPSAAKDYREQLARLVAFFGRRPVRELLPRDFERFRNETAAAIKSKQEAQLVARRQAAAARLAKARTEGQRTVAQSALSRLDGVTVHPAAGIRTVNKALTLARQLMGFAADRGYIGRNVATSAKKLRMPAAPVDQPVDAAILAPAEVMRLVEAADPDWRAAVAVLATGGLRLGELAGLDWGDAELDRGRILVRRQHDAVSGSLSPPKTAAGTRFVELPAFAISLLRAWRLRCPPGDVMFPDGRGGRLDQRNFRARVFEPALRRAGLRRIRVHDLRHTAASMLIAAGVDVATVSKVLGHANPSITLGVYAHAFAAKADNGVAARIDGLFAGVGCESAARGAASSGSAA